VRTQLVACALLLGAGCAGSASPPGRWEGDADSVVSKLCSDAPAKSRDVLPDPAAKLRREGIEAMRAGEFVKARGLFDDALQHAPSNVSLVALRAAAEDGLRQGAVDMGKELDRTVPVKLQVPKSSQTATARAAFQLIRRPSIVALGEGLHDQLGLFDPRPLDIRKVPQVPTTLRRNNSLQYAIAHPDNGVLIYAGQKGPYVVQVERDQFRLADFTAYRGPKDKQKPVSVSHAAFRDRHLYAVVNVDSASFVVAHDRQEGTALWRSNATPGVNFLVIDDYVVLTRGDAQAQLVVLDRHSGLELARQPLTRPPAYLTHHDGSIYVRSLWPDEVAVFQLGRGGSTPTARSKKTDDRDKVFAVQNPATTPIAANHSCAIDIAIADLDAARYEKASARLTALEQVYPHQGMVVALGAASRHMQRHLDEPGAIDLSRVRFRPLSFAGITGRRLSLVSARNERTLVKLTTGPVEDVKNWAVRYGLARYSVQPEEMPLELPRRLGEHQVTDWAAEGGEKHVVVYGKRFVLAVNGSTVEGAYDCGSLFSEDAPESGAGVQIALRSGGSLFLNWTDLKQGGGIAEIDLMSGELRWRTPLQVLAVNFVLAGEYIAAATSNHVNSGTGVSLTLLRRADGAVVHDEPLANVPRALVGVANRVLVNDYAGTHEFEIAASQGAMRLYGGG